MTHVENTFIEEVFKRRDVYMVMQNDYIVSPLSSTICPDKII
ncbi:MAG: hypothetical protein ACFFC0_01550 [Promethearchaeota archaeon]